ncbi:dimethyladenosine transferase 1, mitochondrial [Cylas formicarius]|uniref:dimethyladenosine transferase 1, mitochondrial n=1 Tax=Cylas formicarius TaxID=197179 RepID=UPI0029588595|nr:dimethyladenosine transferase 1, mitochondrial [Cylas formicarius]
MAIALPRHVRLPPLPTVRDLVKLYRIKALKQLSQNFLMDERITDKIVKNAGNISDHYVCEVGPGPGSITRSIIKRAPRRLIVVEKDPRFLPALELLREASRDVTDMHIEINDIREYNMEKGFDGAPKHEWEDAEPPIHLIGNLPFSVSTNLIIRWLKSVSERTSAWSYGRTSMTLTFQQEVAERIVARPDSESRCRLSVMCQIWAKAQLKFTIPGKAFIPKPDVDVGVVTLIPRRQPLLNIPFKTVEKVVRSVFNMRQKYCVKGVERLFPEELRGELSARMLDMADVEATRRPFQLTNEEFVRLCGAYVTLCDERENLSAFDSRMPKILREQMVWG